MSKPTGMMWFDNNPTKTLEQKIEGGLAYCAAKYGKPVTSVWVNNEQSQGDGVHVAGVLVACKPFILKNNYLFVMGEQNE